MIKERYNFLCDEFLCVAKEYVDDKSLVELKQYYADCVDSTRRLSAVTDLKTLLRLLEKRDILNNNNLKPLYYISEQYMKDSNFQNKIIAYEDIIHEKYLPYSGNMYINKNDHETSDRMRASYVASTSASNTPVNIPVQSGTAFPSKSAKDFSEKHGISLSQGQKTSDYTNDALLQRVLLHLSKHLGRSWRDVVRHLEIPEAKIDELELKYPCDMQEQCYKGLHFCLTTHFDAKTWKIPLMRALEAGRRKDLCEWVMKEIL